MQAAVDGSGVLIVEFHKWTILLRRKIPPPDHLKFAIVAENQ